MSYFFVFMLFCFSVFLKQYDKKYLYGIHQSKDANNFEWVLMFIAMLFPGWLAGGTLLGLLGFTAGKIYPYNISLLPTMVVYPLIFGLFPFRKAIKMKNENPGPLSKSGMIFFRIIPDTVIFIFSVYLQIFYFDMLASTFGTVRIASMDFVERAALWLVSMLGLLVMYMPARMHFFFNSPNNLKNKISLFITLFLISIYSIIGVKLF